MTNSVLSFFGCLFHFGECNETRQYLKSSKLQGLFLLSVYQEQKKENRCLVEAVSPGDKAREHILECQSCEKWLHKIIPEDIIMKQKHQSEFCCAKLYKAVEVHELGAGERVLFTLNKNNDPVWRLGKIAINYCPWCGKKLPKEPY